MKTELLAPEAPALIPLAELESINATDAGLAMLRAEAAELASRGVPTTKSDYDHVHRATMVAVKVRTETGKLAKKAAQPHKDAYDAIIGEGKRIGSHALESESLLRPLKDAYEEQQETERKEREAAAAAKVIERNNAVVALGMNWNGTAYTFAEHVIEGVDVRGASDEDWAVMLAPIMETVEAEKARTEARRQELLAEQQRETARLVEQAKQQEAEALELTRQRLEMDRQQAELRKAQRRLEVEQQAIADEAKRVADEARAEADRVADEARKVEQARLDAIEAKRIATEEKAEAAAQLKADKERTARLKSERKDLQKLMVAYSLPAVRNYEQPEILELFGRFNDRIHQVSLEFEQELTAL